MPVQYEHIRDSEAARGVPYDKAQAIAAATYNKQHPNAPMTGKSEAGAAHGRLRSAMVRRSLLNQMGTPR